MRILTRLLLGAILALPGLVIGAAPPASGPATGEGSASLVPGTRILKTFDFEETLLGNFEQTPMFWLKVAGRGYPAYSAGQFDHEVFRSSRTSFRLDIDGGSAAFQYTPGKLPINPNADYYVLGFVKTTPLKHARAQINAWFADGNDKLIQQPEYHSEPYATSGLPGSKEGEEWHVLHFYIPGPGRGSPAKSLVLQLGLLQPGQISRQATPSDLGEYALYQQEIKGTAWFDDIVIFQLPRLSITTAPNVTANIFTPQQNVELDLSVADMAIPTGATLPATAPAGEGASKLTVGLRITDPDGVVFAAEKYDVTTTVAEPWVHRYTHVPLPPGLYTAALEVADAASGTMIARRQTRFVCLASAFSALDRPAGEFGLVIPGGLQGGESWREIPHILRQTHAGMVQLPAWRQDMTEEAVLRRDPPFDALLASLQRLDVRCIANFSEVPEVLAEKLSEARRKGPAAEGNTALLPPPRESVLTLLDVDPGIWRPYVSFLLARYANRVDWWEFGSHADPYSGVLFAEDAAARYSEGDPRYPRLYAKTAAEMASMLHGPQLVIPWNALFEFDAKVYPKARLDLRLPVCIKPSQIPAYLESFKQATGGSGQGASTVLAHLDTLSERQYSRADRLADFAQRLVYARTAAPAAILIDLPMSRNAGMGMEGSKYEPDELLLVYRTMIHAMGNSERVRELTLAPGIKAFMFTREGKGMLIAWNEAAVEGRAEVDWPLGAEPRVTDLSGNSKALAVDGSTGLARVALTAMPVILDRIDPRAVELRSSFALGTTTFPAGAGLVQTEVMLTNSYGSTLTGTLKFSLPKGWTIDPALVNVSLGAGGTLKQAVTIRYPYTEYAGATTIGARLAGDTGPAYDFSVPVAVRSDVVDMDSSSQLLANGDLVIQEVITNISDMPISAQAYVLVPGYPREQRYILGLAPGQTTIKRFVLPMSANANVPAGTKAGEMGAVLAGKTAALGLRENSGRTLMTKALPLP